MIQPEQSSAFGQKVAIDPPGDAAEALSLAQPSSRFRSQRDWNARQSARSSFFDRVFLWLPDAQAPGFLAIGLVLLRQVLLPVVLMLVPFVVLGLVMANLHLTSFNPGAPLYAVPSWLLLSVLPFLFGTMNLVQELNRYAFVRYAESPVRAMSIFSAVAIGVGLLFSHHGLIVVLGQIAIQLIASAVIIFALNCRNSIAAVLIALVVGQTACDVMLLHTNQTAHVGSLAHKPQAITPAPASLQSWARLYPGAVTERANTMTMLGVVNWSAGYTVKASPDQIGAFYQDLANRQGFTESRVILGQHQFKSPGSISGFRYTVLPSEQGSMVDFQAQGDATAK
jgi:hypothetical protein